MKTGPHSTGGITKAIVHHSIAIVVVAVTHFRLGEDPVAQTVAFRRTRANALTASVFIAHKAEGG